jgi:hypothetical protein
MLEAKIEGCTASLIPEELEYPLAGFVPRNVAGSYLPEIAHNATVL